MTAREEYIHRVAQKIQQHSWYENTPFEECLGMAEYQMSLLEKCEAERKSQKFDSKCQ